MWSWHSTGSWRPFHSSAPSLTAIPKEKLAQGERIKEVLKQPQYQPMGVEYQVIIIYAATQKYLLDVPVSEVSRFEKELFELIDTRYPEIPESIRTEKVLTEETQQKLVAAITEFKKKISIKGKRVIAWQP